MSLYSNNNLRLLKLSACTEVDLADQSAHWIACIAIFQRLLSSLDLIVCSLM
uniref:Uncharacterized protein n=1 Tax=Rhizophora mucronata TaxID=61149 RepID=A0A2P2PAP8_RHIMU